MLTKCMKNSAGFRPIFAIVGGIFTTKLDAQGDLP
jgi:hypothetical protein